MGVGIRLQIFAVLPHYNSTFNSDNVYKISNIFIKSKRNKVKNRRSDGHLSGKILVLAN